MQCNSNIEQIAEILAQAIITRNALLYKGNGAITKYNRV